MKYVPFIRQRQIMYEQMEHLECHCSSRIRTHYF